MGLTGTIGVVRGPAFSSRRESSAGNVRSNAAAAASTYSRSSPASARPPHPPLRARPFPGFLDSTSPREGERGAGEALVPPCCPPSGDPPRIRRQCGGRRGASPAGRHHCLGEISAAPARPDRVSATPCRFDDGMALMGLDSARLVASVRPRSAVRHPALVQRQPPRSVPPLDPWIAGIPPRTETWFCLRIEGCEQRSSPRRTLPECRTLGRTHPPRSRSQLARNNARVKRLSKKRQAKSENRTGPKKKTLQPWERNKTLSPHKPFLTPPQASRSENLIRKAPTWSCKLYPRGKSSLFPENHTVKTTLCEQGGQEGRPRWASPRLPRRCGSAMCIIRCAKSTRLQRPIFKYGPPLPHSATLRSVP